MKLMPSTHEIARRFAKLLKRDLGKATMLKVVAQNKVYEAEYGKGQQSVCATQDHCDANLIMDEALRSFGVTFKPESDVSAALWNEAWGIAKSKGFWL